MAISENPPEEPKLPCVDLEYVVFSDDSASSEDESAIEEAIAIVQSPEVQQFLQDMHIFVSIMNPQQPGQADNQENAELVGSIYVSHGGFEDQVQEFVDDEDFEYDSDSNESDTESTS